MCMDIFYFYIVSKLQPFLDLLRLQVSSKELLELELIREITLRKIKPKAQKT